MDQEILKIYSLMKTAEDQLAALQQATGALVAERAALAKDRVALEKTLTEQANALKASAANLKTVGASLREEAQQVTPALQKAVREAVAASMRETLAQASNVAAKALETASEPILGRLAGVAQAAGTAEASLKSAGRWFAWKWVAVAAGGLGGVLLIAFLALKAIEWSQRNALTTQQQTLLQDIEQQKTNIARLQETANALEKRTYGMYIVSTDDGVFLIMPDSSKLNKCRVGPCIRLK
jgi:cell division protein FtsB